MQELEITRKGTEVAFGYQWFRFGDTYLRYRFVSDTTSETLGLDPDQHIDRIGSWALHSSLGYVGQQRIRPQGHPVQIFIRIGGQGLRRGRQVRKDVAVGPGVPAAR